MAALARNSVDTTSYDFPAQSTQHLTVVKDTMAVLIPNLPVVGYATAILEGMNKTILVGDVGVESVAFKASFDPARHKGDAFFVCSRCLWRGRG
jgi:hypothetical protein